MLGFPHTRFLPNGGEVARSRPSMLCPPSGPVQCCLRSGGDSKFGAQADFMLSSSPAFVTNEDGALSLCAVPWFP